MDPYELVVFLDMTESKRHVFYAVANLVPHGAVKI